MSLIKSGIRIITCFGAASIALVDLTGGFIVLTGGLIFAEFLGIAEEWF